MRHAFCLAENDYDYDLLTAVTAYLDCEHYAWLHSRNYSHYAILEDGPTTSRVIRHSKYFGIVFEQRHLREYIPPSEFRMSADKPFPIHTHTTFTSTESGGTHRSVDVSVELPFVL